MAIGQHSYDLQPGDLAVSPAGELQSRVWGKKGCRQLYFQIHDLPAWEPFKQHGGHVRAYGSASLMFVLLREVMDAKAHNEPAAIARAHVSCRALVDLLRHEMVWGDPSNSPRTTALQDLADAVTEAPAAAWESSKMAAKLGCSVSWMRRQFRKEFGMSPRELVIRQRMIQATQQLVSTRQPIKCIAEQLGYDSLHSFMRLFTKFVGMPPGQYRTRYERHHSPSGRGSR